jgi:hypothetical protein
MVTTKADDAPDGGRKLGLPRPVGEEAAAPERQLLAETEIVRGALRSALADPSCQLVWQETTYGRVFSLATLSHQCVVLGQLAAGVRDEYPSSIMALLARHHIETWLTGMYLFMGGEAALEVFLGDSLRSHEALRQEIDKLHDAGVALDIELPPLEDFAWEASRWKYERAAQELDRLGGASGLLHHAVAIYQITYRALSGTHGAHPNHHLMDTYIEAGGVFAHVLPESRATPLRRALLQMALVLTAVHGVFALAERGLATDALARVVNELRPSVSEPME